MTAKLLLLPGDGIARSQPQVRRVLDWLTKNRGAVFQIDEDLVGGISLKPTGFPITDAAMAKAHARRRG